MSFQESLDSNSTSANQIPGSGIAGVKNTAGVSGVPRTGSTDTPSMLDEGEESANAPGQKCLGVPGTVTASPSPSTSSLATVQVSIATRRCSRPPLLRGHRTMEHQNQCQTNKQKQQQQYLHGNNDNVTDYAAEVHRSKNGDSPMADLRNRKLTASSEVKTTCMNGVGPRITDKVDSTCNNLDHSPHPVTGGGVDDTRERVNMISEVETQMIAKGKDKEDVCTTLFDPEGFSKAEIVSMWQMAEQRSKEKLKVTLQEKLELQRRLAFLLPETLT